MLVLMCSTICRASVLGLCEQIARAHDLPGLAVAALRYLLGKPRLLHRMRRFGERPSIVVTDLPATSRHEFDRRRRACRRYGPCRRRTGPCRSRTCAGQFESFADDPEQRRIRWCIFNSSELAQTIEDEEFRHFLDHVPIAIAISKLLRGDQRIIYVNKAFETLLGKTLENLRGRGWSVFKGLKHEDEPQLTFADAILNCDYFAGTFRLNSPKPALVKTTAVLFRTRMTPKTIVSLHYLT